MIRPISKELQEIAIKELNENPSKIDEVLEHLREWLLDQPHLNARSDDQWLASFLRGCKWNLPRTKEKINYFYTSRSSMPELFLNRDPLHPLMQKMLQLGIIYLLPKTEGPNGPRILYIDCSAIDYSVVRPADLMKLFYIVTDVLMAKDDNFIISGEKLLINCSNIPLSFYLQLSPLLLRKSTLCWQNGYPLRTKKIVVINAPSPVVNIFNVLIKPLFSTKIRNRLHIYSKNTKKAYNHIPKSLFPENLGGDNGPFVEAIEQNKKMIEACKEWLVDDSKKLNNEE